MIPLKLQLKNFISYGSCQIIDFAPYHLICLTGKNGHGKSALLDAITWAIWGQARKVSGTSKPDEKLLRLGQSHMFVTMDFISNNQTYRVRREFTNQQGKSSSYLDFGIIQENGAFKALTDKTIRTTQDKIDHAVGLSYDSFINSVFLRQGQSNEFSKKTPQERKEILASILGLQQYEELRKKAQEKAKFLNTEKERLNFSFKAAQSTIQELGNSPQELAHVLTQLRSQVEQIQAYQQNHTVIQQQILQLQQSCMNLQLQNDQIKKRTDEIKQLKASLQEKIIIWRQCNKQLHTHDDSLIQQLQQELLQYEQAQQRHTSAIDRLQVLTHQRSLLEKEIAQSLATQQLELLHAQQTQKQRVIQAETTSKELTHSLHQLEKNKSLVLSQQALLIKEKNQLDEQLKTFEIIKQRFEKRKEYYHTYNNSFSSTKASLEELQLQSNVMVNGQNTCPTCEQQVDADRAQRMHNALHKKIQFLNHRLQRFAGFLPQLKKLTSHDFTTIQQLQTVHEQRISTNERLLECTKKLEELKVTCTAIEQQLALHTINTKLVQEEYTALTNRKLPTLDELYALNDTFKSINSEIKKLEESVQSLAYDAHKHELCKKRLNDLVLINGYTSQDALRVIQQERREQIRLLIKQLKSLHTSQSKTNYLEELAIAQTNLSEKQKELLIIQQAMHTLQHEQESLMHQRGTLEVRTSLLKNAEQCETEYAKQLALIDEELLDYVLLQQAFSKEGIQALLIEHALPELEHEANNLLAKLTDNQASLKIESLRDLKTGGTKETLDITISDAAGTRAYELFSGGEAFRIDFALRVALSKLLARRAGTTLQTLIIDEGFGSQDDEGLANIMEAIHRIQDEFAKIIIVSHLPSMKEQFPVNFYIHKGADGSNIQILQQG